MQSRGLEKKGDGTTGSSPAGGGSVARWVCIVMISGVVISGAGFVYKLAQFAREALGHEAASFAVAPVAVYVLVAMGFASLFVWALLRGQFRDIEGPKHRLLEKEDLYDREGI